MNITRKAIVTLLIASLAGFAAPARAQCVGDIIPDGQVDGIDLGVLLGYWGPRTSAAFSIASDLNHDGFIDGTDLGMLLGKWGACAPVVTSISPNTGVPSGGTAVTISGGYFAGVTSVTFGSSPAASFTITSSSQITAITPPGLLGAAGVEVSSPAGSAIVVGGFTYANLSVPTWATLIESLPDPAVVTDPALRQQIINSGWAWRIRETRTQIEMLLVPPGQFEMGCSPSLQFPCSPGENPRHSVTLTNAFYLGRFEVTQWQWQTEMGFNPSNFQSPSGEVPFAQVRSRPVESVTLAAVQAFLSQTSFRLPTEAEWEYAYRATTQTAYHGFLDYWAGTDSDSLAGQIAWTEHNSASQTRPVGLKLANGLGLHDMAGNVFEWVQDWRGSYPQAPQTNPTGPPNGTSRVIRGGSWGNGRDFVRSSNRAASVADGGTDSGVGFRVARNP